MNRIEAKPKKSPTKAVIAERKNRQEIRTMLRDKAKDQAGRGGINPLLKKQINRMTRKTS